MLTPSIATTSATIATNLRVTAATSFWRALGSRTRRAAPPELLLPGQTRGIYRGASRAGKSGGPAEAVEAALLASTTAMLRLPYDTRAPGHDRHRPHWRHWRGRPAHRAGRPGALRLGREQAGLPGLPRPRVGPSGPRRAAPVREAVPGGLPGGTVVVHGAPQARGVPPRLRRLRAGARRRLRRGRRGAPAGRRVHHPEPAQDRGDGRQRPGPARARRHHPGTAGLDARTGTTTGAGDLPRRARLRPRVRRPRQGPQAPRLPHGRRSEEHTSELQSRVDIVCRLLLEKKNIRTSH